MPVSIQLLGTEKVKKRFDGIERNLRDSTQIFKRIATIAKKDVDNHFKKEEGGDGKTWPRWTKKTSTGRKVFSVRPYGKGGSKMLQDTGFLKNSIRQKSSRRDATVYVLTRYGQYHQTGTSKMQRRKFMWMSWKARQQAARYYINRIVRHGI